MLIARVRSSSPIGLEPKGHGRLDAAAGELAAGGGHGDAADVDAGGGFGALNGLGDGLGGVLHVDDGAAADAARGDIAGAGHMHGALVLAHAVGLEDEAGDLGGAQVDGGHQRARGRVPAA
jgi:hypothetical protein